METEKELVEGSSWAEQVDKMKQLEAGTRGFNAKAASDSKLRTNRQICQSYNLSTALDIVETEMVSRGLIPQTTKQSQRQAAAQQAQPQPQAKPQKTSIELDEMSFHTTDALFIKNAQSALEIIDNCMAVSGTTRHLLISLIFALCLGKSNEIINGIKNFLVINLSYPESSIKETINDCVSKQEIMSRINQIIRDITTL